MSKCCGNKEADLDQTDVVLDRTGVLEPEENRRPTSLLRAPHIRGRYTLENEFRMRLEPPVPLFEVQHHFAKRFVVRDGHMHRVDTTFPHLGKNLRREFRVLQIVDQRRFHTASLWENSIGLNANCDPKCSDLARYDRSFGLIGFQICDLTVKFLQTLFI